MRLWNDRRLRLSLTGLGGQYLLALLGLGAFSVNTGNNLLYLVFALMLGLFLVSGILSRRALRELKVLGLEEGNLFARVRGGLRLRLQDAGHGRIRGLELHLVMEDGTVEPGFVSATANRRCRLSVTFRPLNSSTTSPSLKPALSAGLSGATSLTKAPSASLSLNSSASTGVTFWIETPR